MARPRIFVSSTYYDLKHVRSSLDLFIESLGYDSVLSEKGDIAYTHDRPLDESCYREAEGADIFVIIVGGRYGSEVSSTSKKPSRSFFDRYESITKKEYESAVMRDVPIYILIEAGVYSEYQTFLRNKDNTKINYAHVDSVNVFHLIEDILGKPRNNPINTFERFSDMESWLREQWAGLFRELLSRQSQQQQFMALTTQVSGLKEINETLKKYLEAVMTGATPDDSNKLIESEEKRLDEVKRQSILKSNTWCDYITRNYGITFDDFTKIIKESKSYDDFALLAERYSSREDAYTSILSTLEGNDVAKKDFNDARLIAGVEPFALDDDETDIPDTHPRSTGTKRKQSH